jgi:hypothetical protein
MYFETSHLGENIEKRLNQKVAKNIDNSLGYTIFLKSSPTGEKSPNLVTLDSTMCPTAFCGTSTSTTIVILTLSQT